MKNVFITVILGYIAVFAISCNYKSTDPNNQSAVSFLSQSGKFLSKGIPNEPESDSIFYYSFTTDLTLDFSVKANCCPDSDRFYISHSIISDTIRFFGFICGVKGPWAKRLYII